MNPFLANFTHNPLLSIISVIEVDLFAMKAIRLVFELWLTTLTKVLAGNINFFLVVIRNEVFTKFICTSFCLVIKFLLTFQWYKGSKSLIKHEFLLETVALRSFYQLMIMKTGWLLYQRFNFLRILSWSLRTTIFSWGFHFISIW